VKSQAGFIGLIVKPMWDCIVKIMPACQEAIDNLERNVELYKEQESQMPD
jgi:hypothetical protein